MVFFTCNHCGESLKKVAVDKHYHFKCRGAKKNISCMDCQKDFYGEEYAAHIKCITEAEKYSGKDYVPKEQKNSGAKKQESWMEIVRSIMDTKDLSSELKSVFNRLQAYENVPRKKAKFVNFVTNSMRLRANISEQVWAILDEVLNKMKEDRAASAQQNSSEPAKEAEKKVDSTENEKKEPEETADRSPSESVIERVRVKKSKKRKVDKEVQNTIEEDEEVEILQMVDETVMKDEVNSEPKKKKSKKRAEAVSDKPVVALEQEPIVSTTTPDKFEWGLVMEYTVRKYAEGINLDKLKRKVHRMYLHKRGGVGLTEKEKHKFDKKYIKYIKKCNFKVENGMVKVAEPVV